MVVRQVVVAMVAVKISSCDDADDGVMTVAMSFELWRKNYVQISSKLYGGGKIMFEFSTSVFYLFKITVNCIVCFYGLRAEIGSTRNRARKPER